MVEQRTENPRVAGSIPALGINGIVSADVYSIIVLLCASGSVVEYRLAKARVAGSNPVSRFVLFAAKDLICIMFSVAFFSLRPYRHDSGVR